jgi:hypothetical protein
MDMVAILMQMGPNTKDNGTMIVNMAMVLNNGLMVQVIKESTKKEKNVDKVSLSGLMDPTFKEISLITL